MPGTHPNPRTFVSPTISTTPVLIVPQNLGRVGLFVYNPNPSVTLAIAPDDNPNVAINGPGSITLPPQIGIQLDAWTCGVFAIASSGAGNVATVLEFS